MKKTRAERVEEAVAFVESPSFADGLPDEMRVCQSCGDAASGYDFVAQMKRVNPDICPGCKSDGFYPVADREKLIRFAVAKLRENVVGASGDRTAAKAGNRIVVHDGADGVR